MLIRLLMLALFIASHWLAYRQAAAEEPKSSRYLGAVTGCLDTLINDCTDTYGPQHSPMFCSLVDLKTHRIPPKAPPLLREQRKSDRAYPGGNLQHDLFTLLAMRHATKLTSDARYEKAAVALYSNGLFRAATGKDYYEAANGVGPLLIELVRLHLVLSGNDYPLPRYYAET
jgi:hypothetical protein